VPYVGPGGSSELHSWTPDGGLKIAGILSFAPQPGSNWDDLDPSKMDHIMAAFDNEAVYRAAQKVLGGAMSDVVSGLSVGTAPETLPSGIFHASGCVPHNCGGANAFMGVDPKGRKVYFAQQTDGPKPQMWPDAKNWPKDLRAAMSAALAR
ncbi:MAG: hypothetical protein Q8Q62_04735, partial [Mesorhizobium sp.]|nr:hypothetical protein [Mesorhizobium sp.]